MSNWRYCGKCLQTKHINGFARHYKSRAPTICIDCVNLIQEAKKPMPVPMNVDSFITVLEAMKHGQPIQRKYNTPGSTWRNLDQTVENFLASLDLTKYEYRIRPPEESQKDAELIASLRSDVKHWKTLAEQRLDVINQVKEQLSETDAACCRLRNEIAVKTSENGMLSDVNDDLQDKIKLWKISADQSSTRVKEIEQANHKALAANANLSAELTACRDKLSRAYSEVGCGSELAKNIENLTARCNELRNDKERLTADKVMLEAAMTGMRSEITKQQAQLNDMQTTAGMRMNENQELMARVRAFESRIARSNGNDLSMLGNDELRIKCAGLIDKLVYLSADNEFLKREAVKLQELEQARHLALNELREMAAKFTKA